VFTDEAWVAMNVFDGGVSGDRQRLIASALVEIAGGDDGDPIEAAHALIRWSMRLLDVNGAGVMMADDRGVLHSVMVSSDAVRALEAAELDSGRGPCVESHRSACAVIHPDMDVVDPRWPEFGPMARAGGMRAAHAIPVLGGGSAIGVLNLFRATPGGLADSDAALAHTLAGAVGTTVFHGPSTGTGVGAEQLVSALADAAVVDRAKGMLAVRLRVDIDTAYTVLRHVARVRGCAVGALAAEVVAGSADITLPLTVTLPTDRSDTSDTSDTADRD
jgi:ANTAR domain/GAF domain